MSVPPSLTPPSLTLSALSSRLYATLVGLAVGDALGAGYEFGPPRPHGPIEMIGGGPFKWQPFEWTDDTQMAISVLQASRPGSVGYPELSRRFIEWSHDAVDIGNQTRRVLTAASQDPSTPLSTHSKRHFQRYPDSSAGNGSLMRTAVVAIPFAASYVQGTSPQDCSFTEVALAAGQVSDLTHFDPRCRDASILWTLATAHGISTGSLPHLFDYLGYLPASSRDFWYQAITDAQTQPPTSFSPNGFVVTALQAAWSSIYHTRFVPDHYRAALTTAIRIGDDTDTVAAITGSLLGAVYSLDAVPSEWYQPLHGWPGLSFPQLLALVDPFLPPT